MVRLPAATALRGERPRQGCPAAPLLQLVLRERVKMVLRKELGEFLIRQLGPRTRFFPIIDSVVCVSRLAGQNTPASRLSATPCRALPRFSAATHLDRNRVYPRSDPPLNSPDTSPPSRHFPSPRRCPRLHPASAVGLGLGTWFLLPTPPPFVHHFGTAMKRSSDRQISKDDASDAEPEAALEGAGGDFQRAAPEVLARRRIVKVRRRGGGGAGGDDDAGGGADDAAPAAPAVAFPTSLTAAPAAAGDVKPAVEAADGGRSSTRDAAAVASPDGAAASDAAALAAAEPAAPAAPAAVAKEATVPPPAVANEKPTADKDAPGDKAGAAADTAAGAPKAPAADGDKPAVAGEADKPAPPGDKAKVAPADADAAAKPAFTFGGFSGGAAGGFTFGAAAAGSAPFSFGSIGGSGGGGKLFTAPAGGIAPFGGLPSGGSGSGAAAAAPAPAAPRAPGD